MTRETKIGLLVGLGFIVVFAVLLSHTSLPTAGDGRVVLNSTPSHSNLPDRALAPTTAPSGGTDILDDLGLSTLFGRGRSESTASAGGRTDTPEDRAIGLSDPVDRAMTGGAGSALPGAHSAHLPNVEQFGPSPTVWQRDREASSLAELPARESGRGEAAATAVTQRIAPAPVQPAPTVVTPPAPLPTVPTPAVTPTPAPAAPVTPAPPAGPEREYIVKKGDTLGDIAKASYGTASNKVVAFLASGNKLKDKNSVVVGQKLRIPNLPEDLRPLVEPAPGFAAGEVNQRVSSPRSATAQLANEQPTPRPTGERRAPMAAVVQPPTSADGVAAVIQAVTGNSAGRTNPLAGLAPTQSTTGTSSTPAPSPTTALRPLDPTAGSVAQTNPQPGSSEAGAAPRTIMVRTYEVRAKDTLSSIAARELGSAGRWTEIKKLNQDVDPKKLQPGMKIKLPSADGAASTQNNGRASA